ncbi:MULTISPECIES: ferritin-like domain-containing protein [Clostridium]|jgi:rubrerythrin|uniref:ferritin-like domain-containing protein n=1 Tax=Clostridium TaxID=1485 RepID=UPI001D553E27|nr:MULTISPECIES: ferritin-like domain-containing protein [Clostridium]MBS5307030.1 ferritin-like domain-containing protein [Clostridium sp.]MDB1944935.1 ferritin-like domain-containing protein [Clostridium tertium]MDB1952585.1 ferritin-like domain-containing protein [Clostridium tertium]MDU1566097.1 ferritin-like domain-containing protein [Clostridium sp.]MDU3524603.1 ferritin-like domain-containing protein [Clostridium sp.]
MDELQNNQKPHPQLSLALDEIRKAVQGEREDELFYDYLISLAPTKDEKEIIESIRNDERKHNQLFRKIYKDFTGNEINTMNEENLKKPLSFIDGIRTALFGELKAVDKYKSIRRALPIGAYKDMLFDIIMDELKHASKYNYLFSLNNTNKSSKNRDSLQEDTSKFTPDDWVKYITPLVDRALMESKEGINPEHLYQEFILSGVLVGLGKAPEEAINQVEKWEKTGESKLLAKSKMSRFY